MESELSPLEEDCEKLAVVSPPQARDTAPAALFSPDALHKAQQQVEVYTDASRSILLHLCQRLGRLETVVRGVQNDVFRLQSDVSKGQAMKDQVDGVQDHVQALSSQLGDVTSVVTLMQTEIISHKNSVGTLTMSVDDDRVLLQAVDTKVNNQRDEFDTRLLELNLKLDEIPRALAALQKPGGSKDPFAGFTFRSGERDKLSLGQHLNRAEASTRPGGAPYTDLHRFTIPDDMKDKIEAKIRQKETSKVDADRKAAVELADAYRRLQLAGYPRVTEIHMHVEQCRDEIKRAFEYIQTSNLQLYACCESKIERGDLKMMQSELRALRDKVRDWETSSSRSRHVAGGHHSAPEPVAKQHPSDLSLWNLDKYIPTPSQQQQPGRSVRVAASQVPELRVSLLEMSRNVNALRQQWQKKHAQPLNPIVKQHLEKLVALLNVAYSTTTEEPVDLDRVATYVEKIAQLLGSDFPQHILQMMALHHDGARSEAGSSDVVGALDRYARAFTDATTGTTSGTAAGSKGALGVGGTTHHATTMRVIHDQKKQLVQLREEMDKLAESQRTMEATLASSSSSAMVPGNGDGSGVVLESSDHSSATVALRFAAHQHQLVILQDQFMLLRRQSMQQEEAITELARQLDQWRKDRTPIGALVGQRMSGGATSGGALNSPLPSSSSLRRTNSGNSTTSGDLDAYVAITGMHAAEPTSDRPKSQAAKLDPLQIQKHVGGGGSDLLVSKPPTTVRTTISIPVPVARNGVLHKIQTRSQAMRPKSGVHHHHQGPGGDHSNST